MSCSWPFIDSVIIPDTALTEITVREAATTHKQDIALTFSCSTSQVHAKSWRRLIRVNTLNYFLLLFSTWFSSKMITALYGSQATKATSNLIYSICPQLGNLHSFVPSRATSSITMTMCFMFLLLYR